MDLDFKELYSSYTAEQLFEVLQNPEQYQQEAVDAAWEIASSKGWKKVLTEKLELLDKEKKAGEARDLSNKLEQARIISDNCFLEINMAIAFQLEGILINEGIDFCTVQKYGVRSPITIFYFLKEDFERAKNTLGF